MPRRCTSLDGYLLRSGYLASDFFCLASFHGEYGPGYVSTEASSSLKDAFGMRRDSANVDFAIPVLPSQPITQFSPVQMQTTEKIYEKVKSQIDSLRLNKDIGLIKKDDDSIILRINDSVLFGKGQAKIVPKAIPILRDIADIIRPLPMDLRIEGHTDDIPVQDPQFDNWDLSVARSVSVLRYFFHSDLLPLTGCRQSATAKIAQ